MEPPDAGSSKTGGTSEEHSEPSGMPGVDKKRGVSQMEDTDVTKALPGSSSGTGREGTEDVGTPQPTISLQRRTNMLQDCRDVDEFEVLNKISEGSYGIVYRAKDKRTGEVVALKKLKAYIKDGGFPMTSLREINILYSLSHPSVVDVKEVVVGSSQLDSIFLVMEHMEYELKGFMEAMIKPFNSSEVKRLMRQLLEGVSYLHGNWIIHRDLKTANLLLDKEGNLKICDFGLSRRYGCQTKRYTLSVVTLWYRAPELLLGATEYSTAIDMWSVGCILAELLAKEPLFNGNTDLAMLKKMYSILGTPDEKTWPGLKNLRGALLVYPKQPKNFLKEMFPPRSFFGPGTLSDTGLDLLNRLLTYDPDKRITAKEALTHAWFSEAPLPKAKGLFPANLGDTSHWHGWLNVRQKVLEAKRRASTAEKQHA